MEYSLRTQQLVVLEKRAYLTDKEKRTKYRSMTGDNGEIDLNEIMLEKLPDNWRWRSSSWFAHGNLKIQIDGYLLTSHFIHLFEVKNLLAYYTYENGNWFRNGEANDRNYFLQVLRQKENFQSNMRLIGCDLPILSKLVLINPNRTVEFIDDSFNELVLERWEIDHYLKNLHSNGPTVQKPWNVDLLDKKIQTLQIPELKNNELDFSHRPFQRGILCANCDSPKQSPRRYHLKCKECAYLESSEKALVRTACEFSLLFPEMPATISNICWFIDYKLPYGTVRRIINKFFRVKTYSNPNQYDLPGKWFKYAFPDMKFYYKDYKG